MTRKIGGLIAMAVMAFVVCLMFFKPWEKTIDNYVFTADNSQYTGALYSIGDREAELPGLVLTLHHQAYLKDRQEYQFGFSMPAPENATTKEPYLMQLVNGKTSEIFCEKAVFAVEVKGDTAYYRVIFSPLDIDVEQPPVVLLKICDAATNELLGEIPLISQASDLELGDVAHTNVASESGK